MTTDDLDDDNDTLPPSATDRLDNLERQLATSSIATEFGIGADAATKVYSLAKASSLSPREALGVLALRDPAALGHAASEPQFASLTPRRDPGAAQRPDEIKQRREFVSSLRGKNEAVREQYLDNLLGHHLARAMDWEHHLLPIPKQ